MSPSLTALQGGMGSNRKGDLPSAPVPTNVADILTAAAEIVAKPGAWTQGEQARNRRGQRVADSAQNAVCFCASGAIWKAAQRLRVRSLSGPNGFLINDAHAALSRAINKPSHAMSVPDWNDAPERTQAEVVAALRAAAEKARASA